MARTIAEIKQEMTTAFMAESAVRDKYGFTASDTFEGKFSKVSIEGLLLYVVAFGIWVLEKLFDTHKEEVSTMLADLTPHTTRWYRNRVLSMVPSGQNEPLVKYCSVDDRGVRLKVKVAKEDQGERVPLSAQEQRAVESWIAEEKDAGLKIDVINMLGDELIVDLSVWYDPLYLNPVEQPVENALRAFVDDFEFDGLLSRNAIIDVVRTVPGVELVRIDSMWSRPHSAEVHVFGEQEYAKSGYWRIQGENINVNYTRYSKTDL